MEKPSHSREEAGAPQAGYGGPSRRPPHALGTPPAGPGSLNPWCIGAAFNLILFTIAPQISRVPKSNLPEKILLERTSLCPAAPAPTPLDRARPTVLFLTQAGTMATPLLLRQEPCPALGSQVLHLGPVPTSSQTSQPPAPRMALQALCAPLITRRPQRCSGHFSGGASSLPKSLGFQGRRQSFSSGCLLSPRQSRAICQKFCF